MIAAVFGSTGKTGSRVLGEAVARKWACRVLVRDRTRLARPDGVVVVEGDARSPAKVADTLRGADVVFCCLGLVDISRPSTEFSDSVKTIIQAMLAEDVQRIVAIAAAGVLDHPTGGYRNKEGLPESFRYSAAEHVRNDDSLRDSGLLWTLMCPVTLAEDIAPGRTRYAYEALPGGSNETGYDDLAETMVKLVDNPESFGKRVGIVSVRPGQGITPR